VHNAVSDGMYVSDALKVSDACFSRAGPTNDELNSRTRVAQGSSGAFRIMTRRLQGNYRFAAYAFDTPAGEAAIAVIGNLFQVGSY